MDQFEDINETQEIGVETGLAIIGMAGRVPGARNLSEFWNNLKNGIESISFFSDEEVLKAGVDPKYMHDPHYVKAGGARFEGTVSVVVLSRAVQGYLNAFKTQRNQLLCHLSFEK